MMLPFLHIKPAASFCAPEGTCLYAVGDIHGCDDLLKKMLRAIWTDAANGSGGKRVLIFLGDYIDRGPESKNVVERLSSLNWPGWQFVFLRGNHDQVMLDFLENAETFSVWRDIGGLATLLSYGVSGPILSSVSGNAEAVRLALAAVMPAHHKAFFANLAFSYEAGGYFFAHAGVRPGLPLNRQTAGDLMWIRDAFLDYEGKLEKIVVHGHTPKKCAMQTGHRICLDSGAYASGRLSAVVLSGDDRRFLAIGEN